MTLTQAIRAQQWEIAALRLLIAVSDAARDLPPGGGRELLSLLEGRRSDGDPT